MDNQNVAVRLTRVASQRPGEIAIATPAEPYRPGSQRAYQRTTFAELDQQSDAIAAGLLQRGLRPGQRLAMLVPFNADFITLVFGLLKAGAVVILIDPGMGRRNLISCLEAANPEGFVAIPIAHAIRTILSRRFPNARFHVTVGRKFGWPRCISLDELKLSSTNHFHPVDRKAMDDAAVIFTTGSTGPPKGVLYSHQTFNWQIDQLVEHYQIEPGGADLSGFPLFGLFNAVMGTTTIIPDMDPTRPADVDPPRLLDAIDQWKVNQSFGSPALWNTVGLYCQRTGRRVPTLRRVLSAGAPVPSRVLDWVRQAMHEEGEVFTPYGATEALPVASIESREVLNETSLLSADGAGTCVGKKFSGIEWKVIAIDDGPATSIEQVRELKQGEVGELMVSGPVVSTRYVTRTDQNALHKIVDGERIWHRMGDLGYLDAKGRFWFVGRKGHRVLTTQGDMFTIPCEAIINRHPAVHRSALVGIGTRGSQRPVIVVELWNAFAHAGEIPGKKIVRDKAGQIALIEELKSLAQTNAKTGAIRDFLIYPGKLPTDIRHNAKIFREKLVPWAAKKLNVGF